MSANWASASAIVAQKSADALPGKRETERNQSHAGDSRSRAVYLRAQQLLSLSLSVLLVTASSQKANRIHADAHVPRRGVTHSNHRSRLGRNQTPTRSRKTPCRSLSLSAAGADVLKNLLSVVITAACHTL